MKVLIIIGLIYAISIIVIYAIALYFKCKYKATIAEKWWLHIVFIIFAPFIVLLMPYIAYNNKKDERKQEQRRKEAIERQRIQDEEQKRKEILKKILLENIYNMDRYRLKSLEDLNLTSAIGLRDLIEHERYDRLYEYLCKNDFFKADDVRFLEGALLKVRECDENRYEDNSELYVELQDGTISCEIFNYINFSNSYVSAWKAYLLYCLPFYLPKIGHANYNIRRYIYTNDELRNIDSFDETLDLYIYGFDVTPIVYFDSKRFFVSAYFWNDWQGLVHEIIMIVFTNGIAKFEEIEQQVIYSYDCGIRF